MSMSDTADKPQGGFSYWVSDEQLQAFGKLPLIERLRWVEAARPARSCS